MNDNAISSIEKHASRLDNVQTRWSLFKSSQNEPTSASARNAFVLRYANPIRNYIFSIVRDDHLADEIAQDAVIRLLQGDFAGADPNRGRFRDLLKTSLRNMVRNHWKRSNRRSATPLTMDLAEDSGNQDSSEDPWLLHWRGHLLDLAWAALKHTEETEQGRFPFTTLKVKVDLPDATSADLAKELGVRTNQNVKPDAYRQKLKRARNLFFDALVEEVRDGLDDPSPERIHDELIVLGLYQWLKNRVDREV